VAVRSIITFENPRLRKKSIKIKRVDAEIQTLIDDMIDTMRAAEGIGLAAPQVGVLLRLIVAEYVDDDEEVQQTVLINPEITAREGEWMAEEGCLSIPGYLGTVPRAEAVTVKGKNRAGKDVRIKADGTLAHILQHEIDHLDGVLYIDYLSNPEDLRRSEPTRRRRRPRGSGDDGADDLVADGEVPSDGSDEGRASDDPSASLGMLSRPPAPTPLEISISGDQTNEAQGNQPEIEEVESASATPRGSGANIGALSITIEEPPCCDICGHL
jgi:peptide deformylase